MKYITTSYAFACPVIKYHRHGDDLQLM